jgi:hypothetical protein
MATFQNSSLKPTEEAYLRALNNPVQRTKHAGNREMDTYLDNPGYRQPSRQKEKQD